jgi:hypothetical protein
MLVMFRYASFLFVQEGKYYIPVQVFHNIGAEEFNKLYGLLSEAKLKYISDFTGVVMNLMPILDLISTLISKH